MKRFRADQDIKPLSEFRANAASCIQQIQTTKRPMVLTQRGRGAAVVIDAGQFEDLVEELELLRELGLAQQQLAAGEGIPHNEAKALLKAKRR